MTSQDCVHVLADPKNGVVTPLYSDRQVIRASDLTLDRASHDAALARMRRLLHGWGIVSGFDPVAMPSQDAVTLGAGYAVAPSGAEIFLPEPVVLKDLHSRVMLLCGPGDQGCEDITEAAQMSSLVRGIAASASLGAWLIARPATNAAEPRPGVPQGCENPGNMQLPTRLCHMVQLELLCELPPEKLLTVPTCAEVDPYVCGTGKQGQVLANPFPQPAADAEDYVVICYLQLRDGLVEPVLQNRRTLLPVSVLQDWLRACVCPVVHAPQPVVTPPDEDDPVLGEPPRGPVVGWDVYIPDIEPADRYVGGTAPDIVLPDDGHTDPPPFIYRERDRIRRMPRLGIDGPEKFMEMDVADIVILTGMSAATVLSIRQELVTSADLWVAETGEVPVSRTWDDFNSAMSGNGVSTRWGATDVAPVINSVKEQPFITRLVASPAELTAKGLDSPAAILAKDNAALADILGVSPEDAAAVKTDLMRFTPLMGGKRR